MTDNVYWVLVVELHDGKVDEFRALGAEMSAATKNEPGALAYEWHLTADGKTCHLYERYADAAATMVHLGNFQTNFAERFLACAKPTAFHVYGAANDDVKGALGPMGAVFYDQFAGFAR